MVKLTNKPSIFPIRDKPKNFHKTNLKKIGLTNSDIEKLKPK